MYRKFTREAKIGIVTIIALVIAFFGFNYLKGIQILKGSNNYYGIIDDVSGLSVSAPIYLHGVKVGVVRNLFLNNATSEVVIVLSFDKELKLNKSAKALVVHEFTGTSYVNLEMNANESRCLCPGDTLRAERSKSFATKAKEVMPKVGELLPKIDTLLTALNNLLANPALLNSLNAIDGTTKNLELASSKINKLLTNEVPTVLNNINNVTTDLALITGEFKEINFKHTINEADQMLLTLRKTAMQLNDTTNSLGLLLNDRSLYDRLFETSTSANDLLIDLRKNPKRYVHFSLFGRKNKKVE